MYCCRCCGWLGNTISVAVALVNTDRATVAGDINGSSENGTCCFGCCTEVCGVVGGINDATFSAGVVTTGVLVV